jgi:hypothetical protein
MAGGWHAVELVRVPPVEAAKETTVRYLSVSFAVLALAATGALANPGKGNGDGNVKADRGSAPAKMERGNSGAAKGGPERGPKVSERGGPSMKAGNERRGGGAEKAEGPVRFDDTRGKPQGNVRPAKMDRQERRDNGPAARGFGDRGGVETRIRYVDRGDNFSIFRDFDRRSSFYDGCPPGLAKKYNGCMPPGLARQRAIYRPAYFGYGGFDDARFYYDDGFLIRLGENGRISASIPLLGGALAIGNPWPSYYQPVELRPYYRDYFGLQPNSYRYAGNTIYRVDPETAAITSIAALLTGDDFVIGQPAPAGYPVYNVPYPYRDRYADGPEGHYRYADGYVYRINPETRLVAAAIELLVD